jgi:geranylgeranyl reductase family protein
MQNFDVVVVGAGPAGCAAAYDLVSQGVSVALLDKRTFPRDKPCAGGLTAKTIHALRFSVQPVVRQTVWDLTAGEGLERSTTFRGKYPLGVMTVRSELDAFVLDKTRQQGAAFQTIGKIHEITEDANGVSLQTEKTSFRCRYLIGADGANSRVRHLVNDGTNLRWGFALETTVPCNRVGVVEKGYGWIFPKCDHFNVGVYTYDMGTRLSREHLLTYLTAKLGEIPFEHIVGHPMGMGGERPDRSSRVLLVGDAAGLCEPLLGEGIYYAVRSGQLAAQAIIQALTDQESARDLQSCLEPLRKDVAAARQLSNWFYGNRKWGYAALTLPVTSYCLMRGYAAGMTIGMLRNQPWTVAFRRISPWKGYRELSRRARFE